jgi:L-asparaginase
MAEAALIRPRRVAVLGLGGTIAMSAGTGGAVPALAAEQLLAAVPGLSGTGITVTARDVRRLPGASLTFEDVAVAAAAVRTELAAGADGVVLVQGTDTIEETSYLLDLGHPGRQPVVVTGAMRNSSLAGADGPANLLGAVQVAADPLLRDQGVLVVMADEIHAARRVRKTHTSSPATFRSPVAGPVGYLVEGRPRLLSRLGHRTVVPPPAPGARRPRVGLVTITFSDDGELLRGLADRYDAVVVAALGAGHVPAPLVGPIRQLTERIPVVLASRTGAGPTLATTYGFPGSERDLLAAGVIPAGFLDAAKARVLLYAVLGATGDRELIAAAFGVAGGYAEPASWPWTGA